MKKTLMIVLAALAIGATALAQDNQGGAGGGQGRRQGGGQFRMGGMRGGDASGLGLLNIAEVQKELKMTPAQIQSVTDYQAAQREKMQAMRPQGGGGGGAGFDPVKMREMQAEMTKEAVKKVAEILDDSQEGRLFELRVQRAGNEAITFADVQEKLGLSSAQKSKVKLAQRENEEASMGMFRGGGGGGGGQVDRQALMEEMRRMREEYVKKLGEILTAEQAASLKKMGGAAFKFPEPQQRRPGGGGGGL